MPCIKTANITVSMIFFDVMISFMNANDDKQTIFMTNKRSSTCGLVIRVICTITNRCRLTESWRERERV